MRPTPAMHWPFLGAWSTQTSPGAAFLHRSILDRVGQLPQSRDMRNPHVIVRNCPHGFTQTSPNRKKDALQTVTSEVPVSTASFPEGSTAETQPTARTALPSSHTHRTNMHRGLLLLSKTAPGPGLDSSVFLKHLHQTMGMNSN